ASSLYTREGMLLGTPAYMAPEQLAGQRGNAASDQFALCVSLFEALFGHRPYQGATVGELTAAMSNAVEIPVRRGVSRRVRKALARGLDPEPSRRFPTVDALLPALGPGGWARSGPWLLALVTLGVGFGARGMLVDAPSPCPSEGVDVPQVWDDARRTELAQAAEASSATLMEEAATTLDGYASAWRASRAEACEATLVRGEQSPRLMDLRIACLDRLRSELDGVLTGASDLAADAPEKVLRAFEGLTPVSSCADPRELEHRELLDPELEREVQSGRRQLAEARVRINGGQFDEATAAIEQVLASGASQRHPPLQARANMALGTALWQRGEDPEGAAEALVASAEVALANEQWHTAAEAGSKLTCVAARDLAEPNVARAWGRVSVGLSRRTRGDVDVRAHALACLGDLELADGHPERSIELLERAVGLAEASEHWNLPGYRQMLASAYREAGRYAEAERQARAAIEDAQTRLGSPYVQAIGHYELAWILLSQDRMEDAMFHIREVVRINDGSPNPDALLRAAALGMLHRPLMEVGDHEGAEASLREALKGLVELDPEHPRIVVAKSNLGRFLVQRGRSEEGIGLLREAKQTAEQAWPPQHPERVSVEERLAEALEQAKVTAAAQPARPAAD
nr:tetratricopeptide repeat protein [Deltaproteobacteria bacterium]